MDNIPSLIETVLAKDFYDSLGVFFNSQEKDVIYKKLHSEKLSNHEREVYSAIKSKFFALTNPTLQRIANLLITSR